MMFRARRALWRWGIRVCIWALIVTATVYGQRPAAPRQNATKEDALYDVVIVGAGIAGVSAALEASARGARVVIIDVNSMPGGHAIQSSAGIFIVGSDLQRRMGIEDSVETAFADWMTYGVDGDAAWARYYIENSVAEVYDWLQSHGVKFDSLMHVSPDGNRVPRHHVAQGSGRGLMVPLLREMFRRREIDFRRSVYIDELMIQDGRVTGLRGRQTRTGASFRVEGRTVVIATGGFGSNLAMVAEQWPATLPRPAKMLGGSGVHSQGSGHRMAAAAGAELKDLDRLWIYPTGTKNPLPIGTERGIEVISYYLWLDARGEAIPHEKGGTMEHVEAVLKRGDGHFWSILDAAARETIFVTGSDWQLNRQEKYDALFNDPEIVVRAETPGELAAKIGIEPSKLEAALARYNKRAVLKLEHPPFYALKHFPLIRKTMGGIRTNLKSQVLSTSGAVITGLYSAGEAAGFGGGNINGKRALEGTFLGPCVLTGRVAGREAAAEAFRMRTPVAPDAR